jgi:ATP-dependent DNA ligase
MLSKRIGELPPGESWIFEPKWDGFRALVFRDGDEILIQSRDEKSLNRYFPELLEPLQAQLPARCVLDGEIVIATNGGLDFEALQLRIHPAASRVKLLSQETPASIVFFDLLCEGDRDLRGEPFQRRRHQLESLLTTAAPPIHLTPATSEKGVAADWFGRFEGAGLDGVMAKPMEGVYESDKRLMLKVKHERDCDCVVAGFRWYKKGERTLLGSLLLGLFDDSGALQHVGVCGSFTKEKRQEFVEFLAPYRKGAGQRMPGGQSRWSQGKDLSWEPLRPGLVVEVAYEHMQGSRFRHMAQFRRWRTDKKPSDCTYAQLEVVPPQELMAIFAGGR